MTSPATLLAILGVSVQMQIGVLQPDRSIYGTVTAVEPTGAVGTAIPLATIELLAAGSQTRRFESDANGAYTVPKLDAGFYTLRFAREGFRDLTLQVQVPNQGAVHVDVTLDRVPPSLTMVKILARPNVMTDNSSDNATAYAPWRITGQQLDKMPSLDVPDVIRAIATSPNAQMSPESSGGIHLQGGSADHTLFMIDGIPLYNATHVGAKPGSINPDAVADISVSGESGAREGGRLTGVVNVKTRTSLPDSEHVRVSVWPAGIRAITILPVGGGSATLAARRNYVQSVGGVNGDQRLALGWSDIFGSVSVPVARGALTAMTFSSSDGIAFDALPSEASSPALPNGNRLGWTSNARALSWHRETRSSAIDMRLWQSGSTVGIDWLTNPDHSLSLASRFLQTALASSVTWRRSHGQTTIGGSLERSSAHYDATSSTFAAGAPARISTFTLGSAPRVASAFLEQSLRVSDNFDLTLGNRVVSINGQQGMMEPRAAAALRTRGGITVSAAFARTHQYVQSLYNEESMSDAVASLDIPVAVGSPGVPLASSNSISGQIAVPFGSGGRITVGGFSRTFQGLLLTAPSTSAPFATQWFSKGEGTAYGGAVTLREDFGKLSVDGVYSLTRAWRATASKSYRPAFAPRHNFLLGAAYKFAAHSLLRASASMAAGRRTSPVVGSVDWQWQNAFGAQTEIAGSPEYTSDTFASGRLPLYLRLDAGVRHDLALGNLPGRVTLFANVDNLLGRQNAVGVAQDTTGSPSRALPMMPRSLSLGLTWHF
ncbi:MAG: TonB-dependent receptor [Gemmatimonadota bacterium]|nr:TonB-dependent receptor [Gemmatimonadota bacterium]